MGSGPGADSGATWEGLRDEALARLDELIEAGDEARTTLSSYQTALETNRRHLAAGGRASEMTALIDVASVRATLTERMNEIEQARNAARVALWRLQHAEGMSMAEIARGWGLSRQLVSRGLATAPAPTESD